MTDWLSLEACCHSFLLDLAKLCSQTWSVGVLKGGMVGMRSPGLRLKDRDEQS